MRPGWKAIISGLMGLGLIILAMSGQQAGGAEYAWKAGAAKVVITPAFDMWMSGYASRNKPSEGKVQDLYAKALALEDAAGRRAVILTTDLIGLPGVLSERAAKKVTEDTGIPRAALMLTSSHTHSGPVLRGNLETMYALSKEEWAKVTQYTAELEQKLVQVIEEAVRKLEPARISRGVGTAGFAINRRQYNLEGINIGLNPIGPVDHDVPVLKVTDSQGRLKAILFGYACHNTTLDFYQFCGDYAGYAQEYVEKENPEAVAMFYIGCGADANPNPRRELDHAKAHGRELGQAVVKVLSQAMQEVTGPLRTAQEVIGLPLSPPPSRGQIEEQLKDPDVYIQRRAQSLLKQLDEQGKLPDRYPYIIQVWSFGPDFIFTALAGEVVVDYALRLKHELGQDKVWVAGYANDVFAYIPSLRVLREGGYEANDSMIYYGLPGPWAPPVEEMIISTVHKLVKQNDEGQS
ncbi:MAG: neutral/alkaline non-lysosomal ceramidase N-terminal domain-containing protein [bacterium]